MTDTKLRVYFNGELLPGDIYYVEYIKDWMVCLPIPDPKPYREFVEFALNTVANNGCPHPDKINRHRCWTITGDKELENGDASQLNISPSILIEYDPGKSIHGWIKNGFWVT